MKSKCVDCGLSSLTKCEVAKIPFFSAILKSFGFFDISREGPKEKQLVEHLLVSQHQPIGQFLFEAHCSFS